MVFSTSGFRMNTLVLQEGRPRRYSEQMLKLGLIRELIDPIQVDQQEPAHKPG